MIKGLNRGLGTLVAGGLALAVAELAAQIGKYDAVILIVSTFVVGKYGKLLKPFFNIGPVWLFSTSSVHNSREKNLTCMEY